MLCCPSLAPVIISSMISLASNEFRIKQTRKQYARLVSAIQLTVWIELMDDWIDWGNHHWRYGICHCDMLDPISTSKQFNRPVYPDRQVSPCPPVPWGHRWWFRIPRWPPQWRRCCWRWMACLHPCSIPYVHRLGPGSKGVDKNMFGVTSLIKWEYQDIILDAHPLWFPVVTCTYTALRLKLYNKELQSTALWMFWTYLIPQVMVWTSTSNKY